MEVDVACSRSSVDCQATSTLSSFFHSFVLSGDSIVEDSVADHIDCDIFMCGLVDYDSVDAIVIGCVVFEVHGSLEVKIAGDIDTRTINDSWLIVFTVVLDASTEMSKTACEEERQAIAISIDNVAIDVELTTALRLSEDDS